MGCCREVVRAAGERRQCMNEYANGAPTPQNPEQVTPTVSTPPIPGATVGATSAPPASQGPHHEKKPRAGVKAVVVGLIGGIVGAGALTGVLLATGVVGPTSTQTTTGTTQQITIDPSAEDTTVANAVAAKALPSVVSVYCTYADGSGMGSGVVYDSNGDIITNYHVIEDATEITVTIDGKSYDATLVGSDASSDVAVIKVDLEGDSVTPIEVGDSSDLQVGDWVMSVGSPFGLENSVSAGIVSALYRNTLLEGSSGNTLYTNLIQVDASINPGNSGGALVDSEGKLVGICTLYSSDTESFAGIGFAIPGDYATQIADTIISGQTVTHAYIGLSMATVNSRNAETNNLSVNYGAYVADVTSGSPADEAGIEVGDVIIGIGDTEVTSADGAILAVRSHSIGDTVTVTVVRGSEQKIFQVTLSSDEALQQEQQNSDSGADSGDTTTDNGVSLEDLQRLYEEMQQRQQNSTPGSGSSGSSTSTSQSS